MAAEAMRTAPPAMAPRISADVLSIWMFLPKSRPSCDLAVHIFKRFAVWGQRRPAVGIEVSAVIGPAAGGVLHEVRVILRDVDVDVHLVVVVGADLPVAVEVLVQEAAAAII